jgi:hypothetical protein
MKTRILKTGEQVTELDKPIILTVYTKCPEKYMLVDRETGECYTGCVAEGKNSWKRIESCQISI